MNIFFFIGLYHNNQHLKKNFILKIYLFLNITSLFFNDLHFYQIKKFKLMLNYY